MVAFGPFLQQLVEYPSRNVTQLGEFASAPQNLAYTHHPHISYDISATTPWEEDTELTNVLEVGVWSVPTPFDREPTCSTGQCSWQEFQSVGWCSKCENRTTSATISNCKIDDIAHRRTNLSEYCLLNLGNSANFSLLRDMEVTREDDEEEMYTSLNANCTLQVIWPLSYGNSGNNLSTLVAPEMSSGPTMILGVLNPLTTMGQAIVEFNPREHNSSHRSADSNLLRVVNASQAFSIRARKLCP
jgi:hypothetical protein